MSLAILDPITDSRVIQLPRRQDVVFFPDFAAAKQGFDDYVESRPSSRTTGHTRTAYNAYLAKFLDYLRNPDGTYQIPTRHIVQGYVTEMLQRVSPTTVSLHLAAIRRYLKSLSDQLCNPTEKDYQFKHELRESVRKASEIPNPPKIIESHDSPIQQHGCWLRTSQLNEMLALIDRRTLHGKRDYAILITGLYAALRRAELTRLCLANFDTSSVITHKIVGLQRKRNNVDDIPCPVEVYEAIMEYVNAFNAELPEDDPRRINQTSPIWRQLSRTGRIMNSIQKQAMGQYSVSLIVTRRYINWRRSINADYSREADPKPFTAHDMRRSFVLNAYLAGMSPDHIIKVTGHKSLDMFLKYLGKLIDYEVINVTHYGYRLAV